MEIVAATAAVVCINPLHHKFFFSLWPRLYKFCVSLEAKGCNLSVELLFHYTGPSKPFGKVVMHSFLVNMFTEAVSC